METVKVLITRKKLINHNTYQLIIIRVRVNKELASLKFEDENK